MKTLNQFLKGSALALLICGGKVAFAQGERVGNGGNGVVCFESQEIVDQILSEQQRFCDSCESGPVKLIPEKYLDKIISVEAYDLQEAKRRVGADGRYGEIHAMLEGETYQQYADRIVSLYNSSIPTIGALYEAGKEKFKSRIQTIDIGLIRSAQDITPIQIFKPKCLITTIIYQVFVSPTRSELNIYTPLFFHEKHSELSRGVFMLHESFLASSKYDDKTDLLRSFVGNLIRNLPIDGIEMVDSLKTISNWNAEFFSEHHAFFNMYTSSLNKSYQAYNNELQAKQAELLKAEYSKFVPEWFMKNYHPFTSGGYLNSNVCPEIISDVFLSGGSMVRYDGPRCLKGKTLKLFQDLWKTQAPKVLDFADAALKKTFEQEKVSLNKELARLKEVDRRGLDNNVFDLIITRAEELLKAPTRPQELIKVTAGNIHFNE
jgi:hypothetical protein